MTNDTPDKKPSAPSPDRSVRNDFDIQRKKRAFFPSSSHEEVARGELTDQQPLIEEGLVVHEAYFVESGMLLEQRLSSSEEGDVEWITITEWAPGSIAHTQGIDPSLWDNPSATRIIAKGKATVLTLTTEQIAGKTDAQRLLAENDRRARFTLMKGIIITNELTRRSWRAIRSTLNAAATPDSEREIIRVLQERARSRDDVETQSGRAKQESLSSRLAVYRLHGFCKNLLEQHGASEQTLASLEKALADALKFELSPEAFPAAEQSTKPGAVVVPSALAEGMPSSHRSDEFMQNEPGSTQQMPVFTAEQLADMVARQEQPTIDPPETNERLPGSTDIDDLLAHSERATAETTEAAPVPKPPSSGFAQDLPRPPLPRTRTPSVTSEGPGKIGDLILDALVPELKPKVTSAPPTVRRSPRSLRPGPDKSGKK